MRAEHDPQQVDGLVKDSKKVVSWLRAKSVSKDAILEMFSLTFSEHTDTLDILTVHADAILTNPKRLTKKTPESLQRLSNF